MTIEQLRKHYHAKPFRPFTMHLADGRAIDVEHPEFMALSPSGRTVVVYTEPQAAETIDLLLVTSIRGDAEVAASQGR